MTADFFEVLAKELERGRHRRGQSLYRFNHDRRAGLVSLLQSVRPVVGHPGYYRGDLVTLERVQAGADMSGDHNEVHLRKPHPRFGKLIAHGMDTVTHAFAALMQEQNGNGLVPKSLSITFSSPVFIGEDTLEVTVRPAKGLEPKRELFVRVLRKPEEKWKNAAGLQVALGQGGSGVTVWHRTLIAGWQISALLAKTWPGCLYCQQWLDFSDVPDDETLLTIVRGIGHDAKGRYLVDTEVHSGGNHALLASGQAVIILPA